MREKSFQRFVFRITSLLILSMGFAQFSNAGVAGTQQMLDSELREQELSQAETFLAREEVADRLAAYGVDAELVSERLQHLTDAELVTLNDNIDEHVAGGDAVGIIGTVFLVLLILELLGVTDVFTAI